MATIIFKKNLGKELLLENILLPMTEKENNLFFSKATIDGIIEYSNGNNEDKNLIKKLWKDLLIDSICFLKINDKREKLNKNSDNIFTASKENFFIEFNNIRSLSSYGIDDLDKYFDDFVKFESVLYGSDEHYRDHVEHVIGVWMIGLGVLLEQVDNLKLADKVEYKNLNFSFLFDEKEFINKNKLNNIYLTKGEIFAIWTVIALCHDLGYPIEKSSNINQEIKKILNHFGKLDIDEFTYSFGLLNGYLIEKFLNIVSSKPIIKESLTLEKLDKCGFTSIQSKYRDKISKSLEDYQHGSFSSLLIFKTLTYFLETDYSYNQEELLSFEDLRQFYIRKEILRSICGHTCPKLYHLELNTLSFLLILCDELQEWGRPCFDDLKSGNNQNQTKAKMNKFNFENDIFAVNIELEYSNSIMTDVDIDKLVKRRFRFFHHLLRSAKNDTNRNFTFEFKLIFHIIIKHKDSNGSERTESKEKFYKFVFDSKKTSEKLSDFDFEYVDNGNKKDFKLYDV